jgi:glutamate/tyrosine decarboxylase-like PLP-dependent enzyme
VRDEIFVRVMHVDHPRFFGFVPSPSNFVSAMAEALVAGFNVYAGTWMEGAGAAAVEQAVIEWLRRLCGLPDSAGGLFVSGASLANINALAVARTIVLGGPSAEAVVYGSEQTHSSIQRGLGVLGFAPAQWRALPTDGQWRLDLAALRDAVAADRAAGRRPFCVVANAGTTNTGAIDPLRQLAAWCRAEHLWLHIDGAYGAAAVLCEEGRALLDGLGEADSLSLDPHKWMFQPYETGCLLVRDAGVLRTAFEVVPEYLTDVMGDEREVNYSFRGIQLTRSFRALKLWLSVQVFGREAFEMAVRHGLALARHAEATLRGMVGWEVVAPATLGIVAFRFAPEGVEAVDQDERNRALVGALIRDGFAMVSSTVLAGRVVLRMCPINPRTTKDDVDQTLRLLDALARRASGGRA